MMLPKALVVLATALSTTATHVHNQFGHSGWIQDDQGTDVALNNGGSVTLGGGWGFFWVDSSVCSKNSVTYSWPSSYGGMLPRYSSQKFNDIFTDISLDVYIHRDGFLYDAGGES